MYHVKVIYRLLLKNMSHQTRFQKQPPDVFKYFARFTGKNLWQEKTCDRKTPVKKHLWQENTCVKQVFSCEFCEIFKNSFFKEHLSKTTSDILLVHEEIASYIPLTSSQQIVEQIKLFPR